MSDNIGRRGRRSSQWAPGQEIKETLDLPSAARDIYGSGQQTTQRQIRRVYGEAYIEAHNRIAREIAILNNFPLVVIRADSHNTVITQRGDTVPADPHMTIYMGYAMENLVVQGHIFLVLDENNFPVRVATTQDRKILEEGKENKGVELWDVVGHGGQSTAARVLQQEFNCDGRPAVARFQPASDETRQRNHSYTSVGAAPQFHSSKAKLDAINEASSWRRPEVPTSTRTIPRTPMAPPRMRPVNVDTFAPKIPRSKKPSAGKGKGFESIEETDCP